MKSITTYQQLYNYIKGMTPKQRKQTIQITHPSMEPIQEMIPAIAIGTVDEMEFYGARSVNDNRYHGDEIVILSDLNPFGQNGEVAWEMGKNKNLDKAIYGGRGRTKKEDQLNPNREEIQKKDNISASDICVIQKRFENVRKSNKKKL